MNDSHVHNLESVELIEVVADNLKYQGDFMGVLVRVCDCGYQKAFEYGERKKMKKLLELLK